MAWCCRRPSGRVDLTPRDTGAAIGAYKKLHSG